MECACVITVEVPVGHLQAGALNALLTRNPPSTLW